jgi:hypothetical protein
MKRYRTLETIAGDADMFIRHTSSVLNARPVIWVGNDVVDDMDFLNRPPPHRQHGILIVNERDWIELTEAMEEYTSP